MSVAAVTFTGRVAGPPVVEDVYAGFGAATPATHCGQSCASVRVIVIGEIVAWNIAPPGPSDTPFGTSEPEGIDALLAGKSHVISQFGIDVGTSQAAARIAVVSTAAATRCRMLERPSTSSRRAAVRQG